MKYKTAITLAIFFVFYGTSLLAQPSADDIPALELNDSLPDEADTAITTSKIPADSITTTEINSMPEIGIALLKDDFDKVITRKNENLFVKITENNIFDIHFTYPLNTIENVMEKSQIKKIIFSDGTAEVVAGEAEIKKEGDTLIIVDEKDWEKVDTTSLAENVFGLTDKGEISILYEADKFNMPSDLMEKNALIILRKRTARLKAHMILIEDIQFQRAYGELPYVEIKGKAFGF